MNLLFLCSRNQWRSPTAEAIYRRDPRFQVRSAGTAASARRRVTEADLLWADLIVVMEAKHRAALNRRFPAAVADRDLVVLAIPDDYRYMDPDLVLEIEGRMEPVIEAAGLA